MSTSVLMRLQVVDRARVNLSGDSGAILLVNQVLDKHNFLLAWRNEFMSLTQASTRPLWPVRMTTEGLAGLQAAWVRSSVPV